MDNTMTIETAIARFGLLAVFLGAAVEGETTVVTGGFLSHEHLLPLGGVMIAATAGSLLADQSLFFIGRHYREHRRVRTFASRPEFAKAWTMLERHPRRFIFAFRFLYGLRTISPIAIGASSVPARVFLLLNVLAAIVWAVAFTSIGYVFGHGIEMMFGRLRHIEHVAAAVGALIAIALAIAWFVRRRMLNPMTATQ
jgi:membrane protein DedA with SNARE-associated domain